MSEQFPEPACDEDERQSLPPDLDALYRRLSADGAAWRASVSAPPSLDEQARRLAQSRTSEAQPAHTRPTNHTLLKGYTSSMIEKEQSAPVPPEATEMGDRQPTAPNPGVHSTDKRKGRPFRTFAAIGAMLVIVALIVTVFQVFGHVERRDKSTTATNKKPTWVTIPQLSNTIYSPTFAPSDPRVVYEIPGHGRSDDGGVTWHDINVPSLPEQGGFAGFSVSPLDAHTIILGTVYSPNGASLDCPTGFVFPNPSAGQVPNSNICMPQYISTNGGATLRLLHTPIGDLVGSPWFPTSALQAQGKTLYGMVGGDARDSFVHLVSSTDGGLSWSVVDGQLYQQVSSVCDYLVAPTGSVIFAAVSSGGDCHQTSSGSLWRSDDAGATWTQIGALFPKDQQEYPLLNLVIAAGATPAQPTLYAYAPKATVTGHDKMGDPVYSYSSESHDFYVSLNGGKTWIQAPDRGAPRGEAVANYFGFVVLSDGTLVSPFVPKNNDGLGDYDTAFYGWKLGQPSWTQIAAPLHGDASLTVTKNASGGDTLWADMGITIALANDTYNTSYTTLYIRLSQ